MVEPAMLFNFGIPVIFDLIQPHWAVCGCKAFEGLYPFRGGRCRLKNEGPSVIRTENAQLQSHVFVDLDGVPVQDYVKAGSEVLNRLQLLTA